MEQWCVDGRLELQKRGQSLVPKDVEKDGYTVDLTGDMRGILVNKNMTQKDDGKTPGDAAGHVDPASAELGSPKEYATCLINYKYFNSDGKEVDNQGEAPMEVLAAAGQVTQGVDELLLQMTKGDKWGAWLDPAFAFRDHGFHSSMGSVHAHQPVRLELELIEFENPLTTLQKVDRATGLKNEGNTFFVEQKFDDAIKKYQRALDKLGRSFEYSGTQEDREESVAKDMEIRAILYNNLSNCWFRKDELTKSLMFANKALGVNKEHPKALFRVAMIYNRRMDFDNSLKTLRFMKEKNLGVAADVEAAIADAELRNREPSKVKAAF